MSFRGINSYYVDGVSLTHGAAGRHQHIWTFVAGVTEMNNTDLFIHKCPYDISRNYDHVPTFVGNDYFCESGVHSPWSFQYILFPNDVLWDGQNCIHPPAHAVSSTTLHGLQGICPVLQLHDDIDLRLCTTTSAPVHNDVPIELVELYVQ